MPRLTAAKPRDRHLFADMLQQPRTHHRRQRQRDDRRGHDRDRERQREFAEHAPDQPGHEQQRDEDRDQRHRQRNHGEADFAGTLQRRLHHGLAVFHVTDDILDHHDRIVDHESGADRQRHQRQIVEAEACEIHDPEARDQRQRQRHARNQRRAQRPQEQQHHQRDQNHAQDQRELHVPHRCANGDGAVGDDGQIDAGGDRALHLWYFFADLPDHLDHIGARLPLDVDDDGRRALVPAAGAIVLQPVNDDRNVADGDGRAVAIGDDDRLVGLRRRDLVVGGDGIGLMGAVERSLRPRYVGARNGVAQILHRDAIGGEPRQIGLHPHRGLQPAQHRNPPDAGNLAEPLSQDGVGDIAHRAQRNRLRRQRQRHDRGIGRIDLGVGRRIRQVFRQDSGRRVDRGLHVLGRAVDIPIEIELQRNLADAERTGRLHRRQRRNLSELALQRRGDQRSDHVGAGAGQLRRHLHGREIDLRQRRNRQRPIAERAADHQRDPQQRGRDRPADERFGDAHGCVLTCDVISGVRRFGHGGDFAAPPAWPFAGAGPVCPF